MVNIKCLLAWSKWYRQRRRHTHSKKKLERHFIMELTLCVIYGTSIKSLRMERLLLAESLTLERLPLRFSVQNYADYSRWKQFRPMHLMSAYKIVQPKLKLHFKHLKCSVVSLEYFRTSFIVIKCFFLRIISHSALTFDAISQIYHHHSYNYVDNFTMQALRPSPIQTILLLWLLLLLVLLLNRCRR